MATKRKTRTSSNKSKKNARKRPTPLKTIKRAKKLAKKKSVPKQKLVPKRVEKNKASVKKQPRKKSERPSAVPFSLARPGSPSDEQSGDLQGLSRLEAADSESVEELMDEGNAFEADVVAGVERADDSDEKEVRTHELPEDDVPGEYLDKE